MIKIKRTNTDLQNNTQKPKDRGTRNPGKTEGGLSDDIDKCQIMEN